MRRRKNRDRELEDEKPDLSFRMTREEREAWKELFHLSRKFTELGQSSRPPDRRTEYRMLGQHLYALGWRAFRNRVRSHSGRFFRDLWGWGPGTTDKTQAAYLLGVVGELLGQAHMQPRIDAADLTDPERKTVARDVALEFARDYVRLLPHGAPRLHARARNAPAESDAAGIEQSAVRVAPKLEPILLDESEGYDSLWLQHIDIAIAVQAELGDTDPVRPFKELRKKEPAQK